MHGQTHECDYVLHTVYVITYLSLLALLTTTLRCRRYFLQALRVSSSSVSLRPTTLHIHFAPCADLFDNLMRERTAPLLNQLEQLVVAQSDGQKMLNWEAVQAVLKASAEMSCLDHSVS